jgi:potassium/hydrogen antiporter
LVLVVAAAGLVAVASNRFGDRVKVPLPLFFLAAAAIAKVAIPSVDAPPHVAVERIVSIALVLILFDGGQHIGRSRFREAAGPIVSVGIAGTFLTVAAAAVVVHVVLGFDWYLALLIATAVSPTDPAVVFSVLGKREIAGRSSTILEGESGVNDPVGIALMTSLLSAGGLGAAAFLHVGETFVLEMVVGGLIGLIGARLLLLAMRYAALPSEGLYPLRTLAGVIVIFGAATVAHGSGFLAVFVAGIVLGEERAPYKREIDRFHGALASLGEIVAFAVLGLTVDLDVIARTNVWLPGLILGLCLALVIRPPAVMLCLLGAGLHRSERRFVLFAGLKGAVPILLGSFLLTADVDDAQRAFGIVVVVVVFSVLVQGTLVPQVAKYLRLPMRTVDPEPWAFGVRLRDEPTGVHRMTVGAGSVADGRAIRDIPGLPPDAWVSLVVRDRSLVNAQPGTELQAGDEVLVIADDANEQQLAGPFQAA